MTNIIYCTYLTIYSGNKLPPFYIGSTSIDKINKGYHGSVQSKKYKKIWIEELQLNKHLFKTKILSIHNSKQESLQKEELLQKKLNVVNNPLYINLCIAGKLYYSNAGNKSSEETKLKISKNHKGMLGKKHSEETKKKQSEKCYNKKHRGINSPHYGRKLSEESKFKISLKNKGKKRTPEQCLKMSERLKGSIPHNKDIPHTKKTRLKISYAIKASMIKRKWVNNGIIEKLIPNEQKIPENFKKGRIPKSAETLEKLIKTMNSPEVKLKLSKKI